MKEWATEVVMFSQEKRYGEKESESLSFPAVSFRQHSGLHDVPMQPS